MASITVIAHRGCTQNPAPGGSGLPENSLHAFARAFASGADEVESDLALSRDGRVFLHHDRAVATPDGPRPAPRLDFAEILSLSPETALLEEALDGFPGRRFTLE